MKKADLILGILIAAFSAVWADDGIVTPPKDAIRLDGKLDEESWKQAPAYSDFFFLKARANQKTKPAKTEFRVLADQENIYVGIRCSEPEMSKLKASASGKDQNIWGDDLVEIFMAPCGHKEKYYQFIVSAGGAKSQMYYEEAGNTKPDPYGGIFEAKTFRGKDFWSAEFKIPLTAFYMTPVSEWKKQWLFNVTRERKPVWETSTWSPLTARFHEPGSFRKISGFPLKNSKNDIRIKTVSANLDTQKADQTYSGNLNIEMLVGKDAAGTCRVEADGDFNQNPGMDVSLKSGLNKIILRNVGILKTGKNNVRFLLKDQSGKVKACREYPVVFKYEPLKFYFEKPFYSRCFYPGQDASRVKGTIAVAANVPDVTLKIHGKSHRLPVKNGKADFDIGIAGDGEKIHLEAQIEKEGKVLASARTSVRKLKPIPRKMVWIEPSHRLVINGKKTFGFGWYGGGGEGGYLISKAFAEKYPSPESKHPYNFGEMVMMMPSWLIKSAGDGGESNSDVYPSEAMLQKIRERIDENRNRDFDYYYLSDEPEFHGVSTVYLKHMYDYIKELDPYHPVMIISTRPEEFLDCADILNPHIYIKPMLGDDGKRVLGTPVRKIGDAAREVMESGRRDKLIFGTPQTFNYRYVNHYAVFPTFDETNAWIWGLICNEGQGLTPFIYYDHASRPDLDLGMDYIYYSIERLVPLITSSEPSQRFSACREAVETRLVHDAGKLLLIAANVSPDPQEVTLTSDLFKKYDSLFRFREDSVQKATDGKITLKFHPYQVHILTSQKMDQGLFTMKELRSRIAKAEKERCASPSILFEKGDNIEIQTSPCIFTDTMVKEDKFFDGVKNIFAWRPKDYLQPIWIELGFRKFTAKFSKVKVYGWQLEGLEFSILKYGKWIPLKPLHVKQEKYAVELDFGDTFSTVKCRLSWKKGKKEFEIYEIELLK